MTTRTWADILGDHDWGSTPGGANTNWSAAFTPSRTEDAVFNAGSPSPVVQADPSECLSLDCTGYTGFWDNSVNGGALACFGNVTLSAAMTNSFMRLDFHDTATLITSGQVIEGLGNSLATTLTLADDVHLDGGDGVTMSDGTLAMGTNVLHMTTGGIRFDATAAVTWSGAAKFQLTKTGGTGDTANINIIGGDKSLPPIELSGGAQIYLTDGSVVNDMAITGGGWYLETASTYHLAGTTTFDGGEFAQVTATPDMFGATVHVTGTLDIDGIDLNNGNFTGAGAITVHNATISNMTAAQPVNCTDGCIDGGGNDANFNFGVGVATFIGGAGDNWGTEQGAANANWSTGFTPTITNPVVFDASSPNCTLDSDGYCKSLDVSAYTGAFGNGSNIYVYGDFTNGPDADFSATGGVSLRDDSTVTSNGGNCFAMAVTVGVEATFADDLICQGFSVTGPGTIINQGANEITVTGGLTPDVAANVTWNYSAGAQINMTTAIASTLQGQSSATVVMPPIVVTGSNTLTVTRQFINCVSFDASAYTGAMSLPGAFHVNAGQLATTGDMTLGDGMTLSGFGSSATFICGGDLVVGCSIPASIWTVTGGASAPNGAAQTITGANFGGGSELEAPGCTDGTGNTNVNFTASAIVWDGSESTDTTDADNWTPSGAPSSTADVVIDDSGDNDPVGTIICHDIDFTGFTGTYSNRLQPYGDVILAAGMTINGDTTIECEDDGSLTTNGTPFSNLDLAVDSGTRTLLDDVNLYEGSSQTGSFVGRNGSTLAMGDNDVTLKTADGDEEGFYLTATAAMTYGAGKLIATNLGSITSDTYTDFGADGGQTWPPIEVSGGVILYGPTAILAESISVTDGGIYWDDFSHETIGDFTAVDGIWTTDGTTPDGMNGQTLTVGGNLDIDGTDGITDGNLDVTGTATIHNTTVSNMTSTGDVDCFDNCVDGGGNDAHFLFPDVSVPTIVSVTTDHANGEVAAAGTINIDVEFSEAVSKTETPQVIVLLHNNQHVLVDYTSGTGTDTFRFVYTVGANDRFNALRVLGVSLNGGTITDGTNDADLTMPDLTDYIIADGVGSTTPATGYEERTSHRRLGMVR